MYINKFTKKNHFVFVPLFCITCNLVRECYQNLILNYILHRYVELNVVSNQELHGEVRSESYSARRCGLSNAKL